MTADKKEDTGYETKETTERNVTGAPADVVLTTDEVSDDVAVLQAVLRNTFGVNDNLTFRQKQNLEKANVYILQQITNLKFIHTSYVFNINPSDIPENTAFLQPDIPLSSLRPYLSH